VKVSLNGENMIRLDAKKTYEIIYFILENPKFTQLEVAKKTGVSLGRVNKVVNWLVEREIVSRNKGFKLVSPGSLLNLFSNFRKLEKQSFEVNSKRKDFLDFVKKKGLILCGTSALQFYDSYFRDPSINFYGDDKIADELRKMEKGLLQVNIYSIDLPLKGNTTKKGGFQITSGIRTVIDLFCDKKAYTAEKLMKRLWK